MLAAPSVGSFMDIFRAFAPPGVFPESPKQGKLVDLGSPEKEHATLDAQSGTVPLSSTSSGTANDTSPRNTQGLAGLSAFSFSETNPQVEPRLRPQATEYIPASQRPPEALQQLGHLAVAHAGTVCGWLYITTEVHYANEYVILGRSQGQLFAQTPVAITHIEATQVGVPPEETNVFKHQSSWEHGVIMTDSSSTAATKAHKPPVNSGTDNANSSPSQAQTNSSNGVGAVRVRKGLRDSMWA
jgi:hypothetical protein